MNRNAIILAIVIVVVALMLFSGRLLNRTTPAGISGDVKGKAAPEFELKDLNGKSVKLSDYRGKAVLLNFWATWCPPCKSEMPWFVDLQQRYGNDGLQILGVAMDDAGPEKIGEFAREMNLNYPVLLGKESVSQLYGNVEFLPTTFYIDRDGKIMDRVFGIVSRKDIEDKAKEALATKAGAPLPATTQALPVPVSQQRSVPADPSTSSYPATPKVTER